MRVLQQLLKSPQVELYECSNPNVHDFKLACEVMEVEDSPQLWLALDENKHPKGEHARRFNSEFKEISVLTND